MSISRNMRPLDFERRSGKMRKYLYYIKQIVCGSVHNLCYFSKLEQKEPHTKETIQFDMDATIKALREGKDLSGRDNILTP